MKRFLGLLLILTLCMSPFSLTVYGESNTLFASVYEQTGSYLEAIAKETPPFVNSIGGEWAVIGLARSGREVPDAYYDNVLTYVNAKINDKEQLHRSKSTDNARVILALTAIGKDVTNVGGHNLLQGLTDMNYVKKQGINGPIWALLAFDCRDYEIPTAPEGSLQVSRATLVEEILSARLVDGGWALSGEQTDPDTTAMAIQALVPYYEDAGVKAAVEAALDRLSFMQNEDGSFTSWASINSESCSQVIVALCALGTDPHKDSRFIRNGKSVVDALCSFSVEGGGFCHQSEGGRNAMATEQGYYAMTAYFRLLEGKSFLYDMSDLWEDPTEDPTQAPSEDPTEPPTQAPSEDPDEKPEEPHENPYADVASSAWYSQAVEFVTREGLMNGTKADRFSPDKEMTRAMLVTVLYRMAGSPETDTDSLPFTDLTAQWYVDAVTWAAEKGIVQGVSPYRFAPDQPVTREQTVTLLYRFIAPEGGSDPDTLLPFPDSGEISAYAIEPMVWAIEEGLITGIPVAETTRLLPRNTSTRAQIATFLMRLVEA
ncbi:MAG: S-layer homology domain-containing protein [Oscillospiraceae bacterium]|nr:S-layer homology domain-containing protein [Oscillospiraceae bacterium]